jgi:hypothetical protein
MTTFCIVFYESFLSTLYIILLFNRNGVTLDGDLLTTQLGGRDLQWRVTCDLWWSRSGRRYQEWSKHRLKNTLSAEQFFLKC